MSNSTKHKPSSKKSPQPTHSDDHRDQTVSEQNQAGSDAAKKIPQDTRGDGDLSNDEVDTLDKQNSTQHMAQKIAQMQASLSVKDSEIADWRDKAYRFSADVQNLTKQHELDLQQSSKRGKKSVVQLLLPFIDAMNLSFSYVPETDDESVHKFVTALKGSFDKMISDFAASGIEFLVPKEGDLVDTSYMSVLNASGDDDEVSVSKVVGVGVKIDGQLIQEATVMI